MSRLAYQIPDFSYPDTAPEQLFAAVVAQAEESDLAAMAAVKGWNDEVVELSNAVLVHGDPDAVGERLAELMATGIDGLTISLPANGYVPGRVALLAEVADRAIGT